MNEYGEIDIYEYKFFAVHRQDDKVTLSRKKKKGKKKSRRLNSNINIEKYNLNDILGFPEEFLNDKIFRIIYDDDSEALNNTNKLNYV